MRNNLKNLKKKLDDLDRANKAAIVQTVKCSVSPINFTEKKYLVSRFTHNLLIFLQITEEAKKLFQDHSESNNVEYIVHEFEAGFNAKVKFIEKYSLHKSNLNISIFHARIYFFKS